MRANKDDGPMSVRDLAVLGEAAVILARLQTDAAVDTHAGELAGLGCATIQLVLDGIIEQFGGL